MLPVVPLYELISEGGYSPVKPGRTRFENRFVRYLSCFLVLTTLGCCNTGFSASLIGPIAPTRAAQHDQGTLHVYDVSVQLQANLYDGTSIN